MSIATLGGWLKTYQVYDFEGKCTFKYHDTIDFTVEVSADEIFLYLSALLVELPEGNNAALLLHMLQLNHLGIETRGSSLSIDETGREVFVWYARPIAGLDAELFDNLVGSFLDTAEMLQQHIQNVQNAVNDTGSDAAKPLLNYPSQMMRV